MSKNNLLLGSILGLMETFFLFSVGRVQGRIPAYPLLGKALRMIKPLREMNWANDTIVVQTFLPSVFREIGRDGIIDNIALLISALERLRQVRAGPPEDTVRVLHIRDDHVRGYIYPQTTGTLLKETFGVVSYTDMGANRATHLTLIHLGRVADVTAVKPEPLILSFGTSESHNRRYNVDLCCNQMDELVKLLRDNLPDVSILLTMPPGSCEGLRRRRRKHTYAIDPRMVTVAETIHRYTKDHRLFMWDMHDVVGDKHCACTSWTEAKLIRPDHVHYLSEGYILQGNSLHQAITQVYNNYASRWY